MATMILTLALMGTPALEPVVDKRVDEIACIIWYCHDKYL